MKRPSTFVSDQKARARDAYDEQAKAVAAELGGLEAEYAELGDTWKVLDGKAQVSAAASGVFLGAAFAILRAQGQSFTKVGVAFLAIALIALMASTICAVMTLKLRLVTTAPRGSKFARHFRDLYATDDFRIGSFEVRDRLNRLRHDQCARWDETNRRTREILLTKGKWAIWSQAMFALGSLSIAGMSLDEIIRRII